MAHSLLSRVLRAAGVAILPVVALAVGTGRAAAECGSYVTILDDQGRVQTPADHPPMPQAPCHGPNCHSTPAAPAPVPPAPTGPAPDAKALGILDAAEPGRPSAGLHPAGAAGSAVGRPNPIFHPPRAS
jgi:hypothetical protein